MIIIHEWASLVAQTVKCLPVMQETWVQSLGREDPLEKETATHSSILGQRRNSMDRGASRATVHAVEKSDMIERLNTHVLKGERA